MHKLIYALVEASDRDSALRAGKEVFNDLVGGSALEPVNLTSSSRLTRQTRRSLVPLGTATYQLLLG
jgi:hypothetical protein